MCVLVLGSQFATTSAAASCAQPDLAREAELADLVVYGRPVLTGVFFLRLEVIDVLKGASNRTITVFPGDYDVPSAVHTLYLRGSVVGYTTKLCGGSHPGPPSDRERELFGQPAAPEADDLGFGLLGNVVAIGGLLVLLRWSIRELKRPSAT